MKKRFLSPNALLKSLSALALCFVMLFVMGAVCLPVNAYAQSEADFVDDEGGMLLTSPLIEHFAKITFDPELPANGSYLDRNATYTIDFDVHEEYARGYKMDDGRVVNLLFDTDRMYYILPSGLDYTLTIPENGDLTLWARDHQTNQRLAVYAKVELVTETNGVERLVVTWDKSSPGYYLLPISTNANYKLRVQAKVDGSGDMIDLGDGKKFYTDNTASAGFTKTISPEDLRTKLTDEQKKEFKFALQQVYVAKAKADVDASKGEFVDIKGLVRDANGNIVYEGPKDLTVDLSQMKWDANNHYRFDFTEKLKPTPDTKITVVETDAPEKLLGYVRNANSVSEAVSAETLTGGSQRIVSLTNVYTEEQAKLKITKAFNPDSATIDTSGITFTIEGTKANGDKYGPVTKTYAEVVNKEITLPAGKYKVTENGKIDNFTWTAGCVVGEMSYIHQSGSVFVVPLTGNGITLGANETVEFAFTNKYVQHLGDLRLYKTVSGKNLTDDEKKAIKFTVKTENGETVKWTKRESGDSYSYVYDPNGTVTEIPYSDFFYSRPDQRTLTLKKLPVGEYTVTETGVEMEGYTCSTKVKEEYLSWRTATSIDTDVDRDEITEIYFSNTYTENASITVKKSVTGSLGLSDVNSTLKFKLERQNDDGSWTTVEDDVSLSNGEISWTGLAFGTYRVTEKATAKPNYNMTTTVASTNSATLNHTNKTATFTLNASGYSNTTTYTNNYTPKTTELTISKRLAGTFPVDAASKISFTVKQSGGATLKWSKVKDGEYKYDLNGSVTNIPYSASIKLTGLPAGYTYTVTESTGASNYTGSYVITTTANGASGTSANVELKETNGEVNDGTVDFVNTYRPIAKIKIDKTFTGVLSNEYVNEEILRELRFIVSTVENGTRVYYTQSGAWVTDRAYAYPFEYDDLSANGVGLELEANKTYYIEELNAEVNGFTVSTWWALGVNSTNNPTQVGGSNIPHVEVKPGDTPTVSFINDYRAEGKIVGPSAQLNTKTWAGLEGRADQNGSELKTAMDDVRFKIEYWNGTEWKEYDTYTLGQLMSGKKNYPKPDKTNEEAWITLPAGQYRLTELEYDVDGYDHQLYITLVKNDNVANAETRLLSEKQIEFEVKDGQTVQFGLANV